MKEKIFNKRAKVSIFKARAVITLGIVLIALFLIAVACYQPPTPTPRPVAAPLPTPVSRQAVQPPAPAVSVAAERTESDILTRSVLIDFARAHLALERDWDASRKSYIEWQQRAAQNDSQIYKELNDFLARFVAIKKEVNQLQAPAGAGDVVERFVQAADKEDAALKSLRDNWAGGDMDSFQKFEKERQEINRLRRQAMTILQNLKSPASPSPVRDEDSSERATPTFTRTRARSVDPQALQQFERAFQAANSKWNDFQSSYDSWRSRDYSAERQSEYTQLSTFVSNFRGLLSQISSLSAPGQLRPVVELMVQAAEKEEMALRSLRDTLKPYDSRSYQAYEKEWATIDRLRRQASASLTDLLFKQGISPSKVK